MPSELNIQTSTITISGEIYPGKTPPLPHASISGFEARPVDPAQVRGGLVLIQEIFGVNHSIQELSRHYASLGFWVIAPAFFDHVEPNVQLGYADADLKKGMSLLTAVGFEQCLADTKQAGIDLNTKLSTLPGSKRKTAIVGYCLGGSLVWAAACKTSGIFSAGSGYYGGGILQMKDEQPNIPVILHFGKKDAHIPLDGIQKIQDAHPNIPVYLYEADHGFANTDKTVFHQDSSDLAEKRTLDFFAKCLGKLN